MKEIIKQAKNPVKNRLIPPDIINKYNKKLQSLEPDMERILQEEKNEREIAKMENQANRAENLLKGSSDDKNHRSWFQSAKERKHEKGNMNFFLYVNEKKYNYNGNICYSKIVDHFRKIVIDNETNT